jgi:ribosomal protein L40E
MRYELYSLKCDACGARNAPTLKRCAGCGGNLSSIRRCSKCQEENPPNAFVCLRCYTPLREKPRVGVMHWHIPWSVSVITLVVVVGWTGFSLAQHWFEYAEAQIEASAATAKQIELQHREYEMRENVNTGDTNE